MRKYNETDALLIKIAMLQQAREKSLVDLKSQFDITFESIKPVNLIKNTFQEVLSATDIKSNILKSILGLVVGYASKRILIGSSQSNIKKVAGTILEFVVANFISNKSKSTYK